MGYFTEFIADSKKILMNRGTVYCYYKYQLDELQKCFGNNLQHTYDSFNEWYVCKLKKIPVKEKVRKPTVHVTVEEVLNLKTQGYGDKTIARMLNCSVYAVRKRLGKS